MKHMMNMFKVQMDMFLKHHSAAKEQEQEFLKAQQIEAGSIKTGQYFSACVVHIAKVI